MKRKSFLRSRLAPTLFSARRSATMTADCDVSGRRRRMRSPHFEPLEARTLMAADFLITEFMADNDGKPVENGLPFLDEDGDQSDWIEIQNVGNTAGSLAWLATGRRRGRWVFPNVTVQPGAYLVVFASDKNRTNPASNCTRISLWPPKANDWRWCDQTKRFARNWIRIRNNWTDVSYGIVQDRVDGFGERRMRPRSRVPTSCRQGLGTSWTVDVL